jgi:hypothetical protein
MISYLINLKPCINYRSYDDNEWKTLTRFWSLPLPAFLTYYRRFTWRNWGTSSFTTASPQLEFKLGTSRLWLDHNPSNSCNVQSTLKIRMEWSPGNVVEFQVSYCRISGGRLKAYYWTETRDHGRNKLFPWWYQHYRLATRLVPCTLSGSVEIETTCQLFRCP